MEHEFPYSDNYKRYYTLNYYFRQKFHSKVFKVSLNAGFTCPNRDGTKGFGGCSYCSAAGSGEFAGNPADDIICQFNTVRDALLKKWPDACYIPYFQAFTNTYAPVSVLKERFEPVLHQENVVGLSLATRADCLEDDVVGYLSELNQRTCLNVELGLQTIHDITAVKINRQHSYAEFLDGFERLKARNIPTCVHLINGLPGENRDMMRQTAKEVGRLKPHSVKIHLLHVLDDTPIAEDYKQGKFDVLSLPEYVSIVCDQLELLPANTVIQRITGDGDREKLIAPLWSLKKLVVMNEIDKELKRRNSFQGKYAK